MAGSEGEEDWRVWSMTWGRERQKATRPVISGSKEGTAVRVTKQASSRIIDKLNLRTGLCNSSIQAYADVSNACPRKADELFCRLLLVSFRVDRCRHWV